MRSTLFGLALVGLAFSGSLQGGLRPPPAPASPFPLPVAPAASSVPAPVHPVPLPAAPAASATPATPEQEEQALQAIMDFRWADARHLLTHVVDRVDGRDRSEYVQSQLSESRWANVRDVRDLLIGSVACIRCSSFSLHNLAQFFRRQGVRDWQRLAPRIEMGLVKVLREEPEDLATRANLATLHHELGRPVSFGKVELSYTTWSENYDIAYMQCAARDYPAAIHYLEAALKCDAAATHRNLDRELDLADMFLRDDFRALVNRYPRETR